MPSIEESEEGRQFVAGVLRRAAEMTIFGNPLTNSFAASRRVRSAQVYHLVAPEPRAAHHRPARDRRQAQPLQAALVRRLHQSVHRVRPAHSRRSGRHRGQARACACVRGKPVHLRARQSAQGMMRCPSRCARPSAPRRAATLSQNTCPKRCCTAFFAAKQAEHDRIALADDRTAAERRALLRTLLRRTERRGTRSMERILVVSSTDKSHTMLAQFLRLLRRAVSAVPR